MNQGEVKRGKHAKIRKMKEKYADQDEEDRQMRMALTGGKQVQGFDISKHNAYKHGSLIEAGSAAQETEATTEDTVVEEEPIPEEEIKNGQDA